MMNFKYLNQFILWVVIFGITACSNKPASKDSICHGAVDLGLSVKWATCNVGANSPEEYGDYFAWGETEEKNEHSWETYKWSNDSAHSFTKYFADKKTVLDSEDDVAYVKWGNGWRMPTEKEILELVEKCTWEWTTINGVAGQLVTGPSCNSIFLPAAGMLCSDLTIVASAPIEEDANKEEFGVGSSGYYLSSSRYLTGMEFSENLGGGVPTHIERYVGCTVRPVTDELLSDSEK